MGGPYLCIHFGRELGQQVDLLLREIDVARGESGLDGGVLPLSLALLLLLLLLL